MCSAKMPVDACCVQAVLDLGPCSVEKGHASPSIAPYLLLSSSIRAMLYAVLCHIHAMRSVLVS